MPRPSKDQLDSFWDFADKNGDGKLSIQEFKAAVVHYKTQGGQANCAPPSDRQIAELFCSLNDNNDEYLTKDEYLNHVDKQEKNLETLRKAFCEFDADGNGTISRQELLDMMLKNGFKEKHVSQVLEDCDKDGDGSINFEEFMNAM